MKKRGYKLFIFIFLLPLVLSACNINYEKNKSGEEPDISQKIDEIIKKSHQEKTPNSNDGVDYSKAKLKDIYFAGGCFWGLEAYMEKIYGVKDVLSGYANRNIENPKYEDVSRGDSGFAETVKVSYDPERISLQDLIEYYFKFIDPTSLNRQGNDSASQYRTGIYIEDDGDGQVIDKKLKEKADHLPEKIVVEHEKLKNF